MFSWSKKKDSKRRARPERDSEENEFGIKIDKGQDDKQLEAELKRLAGVDSLPEDDLNLNEGEEDVETELLRLIGGGKGKRPPKRQADAGADTTLAEISDLTADIDIGDEDVEVDENDPELLGELLELTNPDDNVAVEEEAESESESEQRPSGGVDDIMKTLKERLKMYKTAETKAKEGNENSRARRFSRGIRTLEDLLKKAKAGKVVPPGDIPPPIALNLKPAPPPQPVMPDNAVSPTEDASLQENGNAAKASEPENILKTLTDRLKMYQAAEVKAKEAGETTRARRFNRGMKTLEGLIKHAQAGKPVAPEDIPPEVALNLKPAPPPPPPSEDAVSDNFEGIEDEINNINLASPSAESEPKEQEQERNIMDVLSERLQMYKTAEAKAKEAGETTRARRFGRGIKTIQGLIRQATGGTPIAPDDIPPMIALNLKPAPPVVLQAEEPEEARLETENLVRSSHAPTKPISFAAVDDVDLDELPDETPTTVLEGLEQRMRLYRRFHEKAKAEGDIALALRNEKIVRVYENAIKTYKSGGYVDVLKLPNPNGCPPIPIPFFVPGD